MKWISIILIFVVAGCQKPDMIDVPVVNDFTGYEVIPNSDASVQYYDSLNNNILVNDDWQYNEKYNNDSLWLKVLDKKGALARIYFKGKVVEKKYSSNQIILKYNL